MLRTARTVIAPVGPGDGGALYRYYHENRSHLAPWEPEREDGELSPEGWVRRAEAMAVDHATGRAIPLVARLGEGRRIAAFVSFTGIARGAFQACYLGYSVAREYEGTGLMTEVLEAAIAHAFEDHGLHRIMANHLPENERSARLLARLGFEREGFARDYLKIAGRWRDHVLTAKINPEV